MRQALPNAVLDQLLAGADPRTALEPNGLLDDLKKALAERVRNAEMDHHLAGKELGNRRNGYGKKTVITDTGRIELAVPRDCRASFDPQLIARYRRRFPGFDDKIISMYARGMSWKDRKAVTAALKDIYRAVDAEAGEAALGAFEEGPWGRKYPAISQSW